MTTNETVRVDGVAVSLLLASLVARSGGLVVGVSAVLLGMTAMFAR